MAAGSFTGPVAGFPVIPAGPESRVRVWIPQDPNQSTESYFTWVGQAHHTNKVGLLVPAYFTSYFSAQQ